MHTSRARGYRHPPAPEEKQAKNGHSASLLTSSLLYSYVLGGTLAQLGTTQTRERSYAQSTDTAQGRSRVSWDFAQARTRDDTALNQALCSPSACLAGAAGALACGAGWGALAAASSPADDHFVYWPGRPADEIYTVTSLPMMKKQQTMQKLQPTVRSKWTRKGKNFSSMSLQSRLRAWRCTCRWRAW